MTKPKQLYWIGDRDRDGRPLEFFGAVPGVREAIPAHDLSPEETAQLTEAQWEAIDSPTGRRLYRRTDPDPPKPVKPAGRTSGASSDPTEASESNRAPATPSDSKTEAGSTTAKSAEP